MPEVIKDRRQKSEVRSQNNGEVQRRKETGKLVIGLTGGVGSGKSTVLAEFRRLGAKVWDADKAAHSETGPGTKTTAGIKRFFGKDFFDGKGKLKRKKLGETVFHDPRLRRELERIVHPAVISELKLWLLNANKSAGRIYVADVPLLFETGLVRLFNRTVVVRAPADVQLKRICRRNSIPENEAIVRINSQWSLERKAGLADDIIDNGGTKANTRKQVKVLMEKWKKTVGGNH